MKQEIKSNLIWIGDVVNTHGIKGEVRVLTSVEKHSDFFKENKILKVETKDENLKELIISSVRKHKSFILLKFKNINNINDILWLKNKKLMVERDVENDNYYLFDLIGKKVEDQTGDVFGVVYSFIDQGPYKSLLVKLKNNKFTNIPMIEEFDFNYKEREKKIKVNIPIEFKNI